MAQSKSPSTEMNLDAKSYETVSSSLTNGSVSGKESENINAKGGEEPLCSLPSLTDITLESAVTKIKEIEQANLLLRDYMRKNNDDVKRQYEALRTLKMKEKEKNEQTKAVITALRKENEEMQERIMNQDESMSEFKESVTGLEGENSRLQHIIKELQEKLSLSGNDITDAVYVSVGSQETVIAELKNTIASKEDCIDLLKNDLSKHQEELEKYQTSSRQLLKDLEAQQALKEATDGENRQLNQQIVELDKKLHEQMHISLSSTKRELESRQGIASQGPAKVKQQSEPTWSLLHPESVDDLLERAQSMEEEKYSEAEKMKMQLDKEMSDKKEMEKTILSLREKMKVLADQNNEVKHKLVLVEQNKSEEIQRLCQDYEAKLTEKTRQDADQQHRELVHTEDAGVMKSQILSLVQEINEAQSKLAHCTQTISHKDEKINMLLQNLNSLEKKCMSMEQENQLLIRHMEGLKNSQIQAHEQNQILKQEYNQIQLSFDKLVTDYTTVVNMLESFKADKQRSQMQQETNRRPTSQNEVEMDRLHAEVIAAEEALEYKEEALADLKEKYLKLQDHAEFLGHQADTYRLDFDSEREARTKLAHEREEILRALKECQAENQGFKEAEFHHRIRQGYQEAPHQPRKMNEGRGADAGAGAEGYYANEMPAGNTWPPPGQQAGQAIGPMQQPVGAHAPFYRPTQQQWPPHTPKPAARLSDGQYPPQLWEREPLKVSEEEVGDASMMSFKQYDCPYCLTLFPDLDSLNLHVQDCTDGK